MNVCKSLHALLVAATAVTDKVAVYSLATGGPTIPAIFTSRVIPRDSGYPAIRITQVSVSPFGCRSRRGGLITVDVRVFGDRETSDADLRLLAHEVWNTLDRADNRAVLAVDGMEPWGCEADLPQFMQDEDGFPGYLVQTRVRVLEAA